MADVFISYSHYDRSFADGRGLERILKSADPALTFWRDSSIEAGSTWNDEIRNQLSQCRCIVVLWSKNSWASTWVRQEAFYGYVREILLPIRLDDVVLEPPFTHIQCVDGSRPMRDTLLSAIGQKLSR